MASLLRTVLYQRHVELGAQIVEFGGWEMPVQYPAGILAEHLATRSQAGLFDVSHMGRFIIRGRDGLDTTVYNGHPVWLGRTGYTGEPLCFELFIPVETATAIWDALLDKGARPIGLGARDTLRLEAGLPLYGHELGDDPQGRPIPIFAISLARFAVSFSPLKGDFVGRQALLKQYECLQTIIDQRQGDISALPRRVRTVELIDKGIARAGALIYYQGTDFIQAVEEALVEQMCLFLGCSQVETRPISGQMANMVLFSAMVDFINRTDRKVEQRRIRQVMNHHIIKGGHLSAQPMGALRDYVMRDSQTERPAVVNFPVLAHNPYQVDVDACAAPMERALPLPGPCVWEWRK